MLKILFFGDVVGKVGREALIQNLPLWKEKYSPDFIIANGENAAHGRGITEKNFKDFISAGIDVVTSGNHIFDTKDAPSLLSNHKNDLLRPLNYPSSLPGRGYLIKEKMGKKLLVINLMGRVFMRENLDDPLKAADEVLEKFSIRAQKDPQKEMVDGILVDWHAEATSEKKILGWHLDGKVSAVLGTHTHIPTADERILPYSTAYITDVGMVGATDSVLGFNKEDVLKRFLTQTNSRMEVSEEGKVEINFVLIEINEDGKAKNIQRIREIF